MILLRVWAGARFWRELAYLISGVLVRLPPFVVAVLGIAACGLSVVIFGLALLAGVLALARRTPRYLRAPARKILGWDWPDARPVSRNPLTDNTAWRAMLYCFLGFLLCYLGAYLTVIGLAGGLAAVTYPAWWFLSHNPGQLFDIAQAESWASTWAEAVKGLVLLLVVPWFVRVVVLTDGWLVRALLHPSSSAKRIAELEAGRTALQADAAALLRRVERDLHDGTQARLVSLGVQLARIEHKTDQPDVRALAADSRRTVTEALTELRDIVRGLHPPALDDGLEVALSTLAGRSAVPADVTVRLTGRPADATASAIYFTVAELLTNVARHAAATRASIALTDDRKQLTLTVRDNGRGGAGAGTGTGDGAGDNRRGTGLAGLRRRAEALDGKLLVESPVGGPTVVTMTLPREY
ncbi:sensor histidine kinase [Paractinoplanes ferrugineus]|uniref:histidine kinase n=1 Tax=Paractinoplanes ferrugineus TaxID=113564 RepID=A0A919MJX5_9ACTN|nr:sensor domain-containing protein [Actinoplanes ferrugineus]GIE10607.1 histidine kinase [Actinoplanes ferrugineus]